MFEVPKIKDYVPLQVGAENKQSLGFLQDNVGNNISYKNSNYCELTGLWPLGVKAQSKANGSYRYRLPAVRLFFPGGTGRSLLCCLCRHAGKPYRAEAGGKDAGREKGAATAGACLFQDPPCPGRAETAEKRQSKSSHRQKHESDFIIADAAARYFKENGISKLPGYKALQAEIESLIQEKNSGYNDYRAKREEYRRLQTVKGNIDHILHRERKPVKRQEQER